MEAIALPAAHSRHAGACLASEEYGSRDALPDKGGRGFFGKPGDAVLTGLTPTNVKNFRGVLIATDG